MDWGWTILIVGPLYVFTTAYDYVTQRVIGGNIHWNSSITDDNILRENESNGIYCQCRACKRKRGF